MSEEVLYFFSGHEGALPIYHALADQLTAMLPDLEIKVQQTQISFYNQRLFACVSFLPVRKKADRPENYLTITFGLNHLMESERIDAASEPYPKRFTHHMMVGKREDIDAELLSWLQEAAVFAAEK